MLHLNNILGIPQWQNSSSDKSAHHSFNAYSLHHYLATDSEDKIIFIMFGLIYPIQSTVLPLTVVPRVS